VKYGACALSYHDCMIRQVAAQVRSTSAGHP
jgi:hypothetical protein